MIHLAFDLGASSGKLLAGKIENSKIVMDEIHRFENGPLRLANGLYWNFMGIYSSLIDGLKKARARFGNDIASLGIDSFSSDFSLVDKDGDLICPVRCYRDERTARTENSTYATVSKKELYFSCGNQIAPFNTLVQIAAMRAEGKDEALGRAHRLLFVPDLLTFYLTGEAVSEYTVASVSQMYSFHDRTWNEKILRAFNIPSDILAEIIMPGTREFPVSSRVLEDNALLPFSVIPVCEHDTASAFLASPEAGTAILSSGTWSLLGCEADSPIITDFSFTHNIANEGGYPGPHHRLLCNIMGTWLLQQLRNELSAEGTAYGYDELRALAERQKPSRWFIDVDHADFFSPGGVRRKILRNCVSTDGSLPETPGDFTRCAYDNLALKYRHVLDKIEKCAGKKFEKLIIVGGGSRDSLMCQSTADACGLAVSTGIPDSTALGNIAVQMIARKELKDVAEARELIAQSYPPKVYEPRGTSAWDDAYEAYERALFA
ncbi:MAG: rhamnulokinase [Synergistaceae bacterium]|jgi:sugar (pentulose or hexulose) kinase|nr:rhamnulokinase [Synergistaceae bacterium]